MAEERKFPLQVWQLTDAYATELKQAQERRSQLIERMRDRRFPIYSLRFDEDGNPEVWVNEQGLWARFHGKQKNWSAEEAMECALMYGDSGWWSLDEVEDFANNTGIIVEEAMWECGYRRRRKDQERWARRGPNEKQPNRYVAPELVVLEGDETERLKRRIVIEHDKFRMGHTFSVTVGKRGMIHCALDVNPFTGTSAQTLYLLGQQIDTRGHFAIEQDGFTLSARNVRIEDKDYVHVSTHGRIDEERLWPTTVNGERFRALAEDLLGEAWEPEGFNIDLDRFV